jgi:hypothetical protein
MEKITVVFGFLLDEVTRIHLLNSLLDQINGISNFFQLSFLDTAMTKKMVSFRVFQTLKIIEVNTKSKVGK